MAKLYLIRHGTPALTGTFLGQFDSPLADGVRDELRETLSKLTLAIAYVSPLRRARETAECLACSQQVVLPNLREIGFGEWTGKAWDEIERTWPQLAAEKLHDWLTITPPGGEPWIEFVDRVNVAWRVIRSGPSPVAVVAHQAVNGVLANLASGVSALEFTQKYGEATEIEYVAP